MSIIILLVCFVVLFINLAITLHEKLNWKELLLTTVLSFSIVLTAITELLSLFHQVNYKGIFFSWVLITSINFFFLFYNRKKIEKTFKKLQSTILNSVKKIRKFDFLLSGLVVGILILIFIQGVIYPPNNWDSMTYHLGRIVQWLSQNSVEHFPSHIFRQVYQPPFAEFVMMHFNVLSNADFFANSVQFFFFLFSLFAIVLIVELFELSSVYKLYAIVLSVTIPEIILQASCTQNDVVVAFFVLNAVYFAAKSFKENRLIYFVLFGCAFGLGIFTKATAYIFLFPVLLLLISAVVFQIIKAKKIKLISFLIMAGVIALSINAAHFSRNYALSSSILGADKEESKMYTFEKHSPMIFLSNFSKHVALHFGPYPLNIIESKMLNKLHNLLHIDMNSSAYNFNNTHFSAPPNIPNNEDDAPNSIQIILIFFAVVTIGFSVIKNKSFLKITTIYWLIFLAQLFFFCYNIKWSPWQTRIHSTLFLFAVPLICYVISLRNYFLNPTKILLLLLLLGAYFIIVFNSMRPLVTNIALTKNVNFRADRFKNYFAYKPEASVEYAAVIEKMEHQKFKNIGLIMAWDDWEYPLFYNIYATNRHAIHINVSNNISKSIPNQINHLDCIVSTNTNDSVLNYNGIIFKNLNRQNKSVWLYEQSK